MLHLVCSSDGLNSCQRFVRFEDVVFFMGDATSFAKSMECEHTYVINCDSKRQERTIPHGIDCVGYDELVDLVVEHSHSVSWS